MRPQVEVIGKGLVRDFSTNEYLRYDLPRFKYKKTCLVLFGRCNLKCIFCFAGGAKSKKTFMPNSKLINLDAITNELLEQKDSVIRFSGGEPTLYEDELHHIATILKDAGIPMILDTNGTNPDVVKRLASLFDVISVDGPKTCRALVEKRTGRSATLSWDLPVKTLESLKYFSSVVEVKTVIFDKKDIDHAQFLAQFVPVNGLLTLKTPRESHLSSPDNINSERINARCKISTELRGDEILKCAESIRASRKRNILVVQGSTRSAASYTHFKI